MNCVIGIALATYNGGQYIDVMLNSINAQSFQDFHIHVCDDGSTDDTVEKIKSSAVFKNGKLSLHEIDGGNGAMRNFRRAISYCNEDYVALCDQDDYWSDNKLEVMLERIKCIESKVTTPVLVFSDLDIVDKNLKSIHRSFFRDSVKSSLCKNPQDFVINNHVPGCAMMFNSISRGFFEKIPDGIRMHDWWIIFLASLYGEIDYIDLPMIKYRQHDNNTIGVPGINRLSIIGKVKKIAHLPSALKKSSHMMSVVRDWVNEHPELTLSPRGAEFIRKLDSGIFGRISLFIKSYPGESFILSFLIWCLL